MPLWTLRGMYLFELVGFFQIYTQEYVYIYIYNFFSDIYPEIPPSSGIAGSYGISVFSFLRNFHTVFHSSCCTNLLSHQTAYKGFLFSTSSPMFVICVLFDDGHSDLCEWSLISLMISDIEHLFMCLLAICISSLENVCSVPLPVFFLIELYELFIYADQHPCFNFNQVHTPASWSPLNLPMLVH